MSADGGDAEGRELVSGGAEFGFPGLDEIADHPSAIIDREVGPHGGDGEVKTCPPPPF